MSRRNQVNEGIQASNVTSEVLAVGRNAKAVKQAAGSAHDFDKLAADLERAIETLNLGAAVKSDAAALRNAGPSADAITHIDRLQKVVNGLKAAGVVLTQTASLADPLTKIAGLLKVPLHLIGL